MNAFFLKVIPTTLYLENGDNVGVFAQQHDGSFSSVQLNERDHYEVKGVDMTLVAPGVAGRDVST